MNQTTDLVADTICRTIELGVTITGATIGEKFTHIDRQPVEHDPTCPTCHNPGRLRDHVIRTLTDPPIVVLRPDCISGYRASPVRCRCSASASTMLPPRKPPPPRRTNRWILRCLAVEKMSVSTVLGVGWDVVSSLTLSAVHELAYNQPGHLDRVRVLGVDEHKWKHVRGQGDPSFVTVTVDLTPVIDGTGPARLLDMVAGRSAAAFSGWLRERDQAFRDRVTIVSMDGFTGYHSSATDVVPQARTVMDPFHVMHLAAEKLTVCRQRVQQITHGHRGRSGDPLYGIKPVLLTRKVLRTYRQNTRLAAVFANEHHIEVEVTEHLCQDLVAEYADPNKRAGKLAMFKILTRIKSSVPKELVEWRNSIAASGNAGKRSWRTSIPGRPMVRWRRSTADSSTSAVSRWVSGTSSTMRSLIHSGQLRERINAL